MSGGSGFPEPLGGGESPPCLCGEEAPPAGARLRASEEA